MKDFDLVHFFPSEALLEKAEAVFRQKKKLLETIVPGSDIQHVGSASIPGAMGKFDVDLQIRIARPDFGRTVEAMERHFISKHPELWTDEFALFHDRDESPEIDYCVTVIGSRKDDFHRVRDFLKSHPQTLREYNELKKQHEGRPYHEYRNAKMKFLGGNGTVRFLEY